LPKPAPATIYAVAGDWVFLAMLALGLVPALWQHRPSRSA
jgi:hypothetical protein